MTHILTIILDEQDQNLTINWFASDGLTDQAGLIGVQAVERRLQRRVLRAELEAERQAEAQAEGGQ